MRHCWPLALDTDRRPADSRAVDPQLVSCRNISRHGPAVHSEIRGELLSQPQVRRRSVAALRRASALRVPNDGLLMDSARVEGWAWVTSASTTQLDGFAASCVDQRIKDLIEVVQCFE